MIRSYEHYNSYIPVFIQTVEGIKIILLIAIVILLFMQNRSLNKIERRFDKMIAK